MEVIEVYPECIIDLIKLNTCSYYNKSTYQDITINISDDSTYQEGDVINLSKKDLGLLMFNKVIKFNDFYIVVI
jgi:hypothetical protein